VPSCVRRGFSSSTSARVTQLADAPDAHVGATSMEPSPMSHAAVFASSLRARRFLAAGAALAVVAMGCHGSDSTAPPPKLVNTGPENSGTPDVSGFYTRVDVAPPADCTPAAPPPGGTVILGNFNDTQPIKLYQNGTRLTLAYTATPQQPADTGRVDLDGKIALGVQSIGYKENLRSGRQFYVDLTGSMQLTSPSAGKYAGSGTYVYVFHEDSPNAPVFATCSRTVTFDFTKTG
jgi:hypothetical protein